MGKEEMNYNIGDEVIVIASSKYNASIIQKLKKFNYTLTISNKSDSVYFVEEIPGCMFRDEDFQIIKGLEINE